MYDDWWFGMIAGYSCPRPGYHEAFLALFTDRGDGSEAAMARANKQADTIEALMHGFTEEDRPILDTIHFRPGTLTKADSVLARYLGILRNWPRAHPSSDFIR
jgi:hypothetical protein